LAVIPLEAKRLELLKEALPGISRVGVLWETRGAWSFNELHAPAQRLGLELVSLRVSTSDDLTEAFETAVREQVDGVFAIEHELLAVNRVQVAELALDRHLPGMYFNREFAERGGLMVYSSNSAERYRRAAAYVDKILRGAKPADLPIEQPMRFEFVINLRTAETLGLIIPERVLIQATDVIR
jgi:putative ABC transport system substrate-binding protein